MWRGLDVGGGGGEGDGDGGGEVEKGTGTEERAGKGHGKCIKRKMGGKGACKSPSVVRGTG